MRHYGLLMMALISGGTAQGQELEPVALCGQVDASIDPVALERALGEKSAKDRALALKNLVDGAPDSGVLHHHLAQTYYALGDFKQAHLEGRRAALLLPACAEAAQIWVDAAKADGDVEGEIAALNHLNGAEGGVSPAHRARLLSLYLGASQLEAALPHAKFMAERPDAQAEDWALYGDIAGWLEQDAEALTAYKSAQKIDAKVFTGKRWHAFGEVARRLSQPNLAVEAYAQAIKSTSKSDPTYVASLLGQGWAYRDMSRHGKAADAFIKALSLRPKDPGIHASAARALHKDGKTDKAIPHFRQSLALKEDAALRFEAAQVIASVEDLRPQALDFYRPLIASQPIPANYGLAYLRLLSWMPEHRAECAPFHAKLVGSPLSPAEKREADGILRQSLLWTPPQAELIDALEALLLKNPDDLEASQHLVACFLTTDDRRFEAVDIMTRILSQSPGDTALRLQRVELMAQMPDQNTTHLLGELERVSRESTGQAEALNRVGYLYLKLGAPEAALVAFGGVLSAEAAHCDGQMGQGESFAALDRAPEALNAFERALAICQGQENQSDIQTRIQSLKLASDLQAAKRLSHGDDWHEAAHLYGQILDANPGDVEIWTSLGALYANHGDFQKALDAFEGALALEADHLGALKGASGAALALGDFDSAEAYLKRELEVAPSANARARLEALSIDRELRSARDQVASGSYERALDGLSQLFLSRPDDGEVALLYGEALFRTGRLNESVEAYRRAVRLMPNSYRATRGAAEALWQSGRRDEARQMLEKSIALASPEQRDELRIQAMYWNLQEGEVAKEKGELTRALNLFRHAYHFNQEDYDVLMALGGLYWHNQQLPLASKYYVQATILHPERSEAARAAAETLLAQDRAEQAYDLLKDNPARQYPAVESVFQEAVLAKELRAVEEAWQRGERAIAVSVAEGIAKDYPGKLEPWRQLARLSLREGRLLDTLSFHQRALAVNPNSESDLYGVIATLQTLHQHAEAARLIVQARARQDSAQLETPELDRLEAAGWVARGEAHKRVGEYQAALQSYRRALQLSPGESWVLAGLGGLYLTTHQMDSALEAYDQALTRNSREVEAIRGRAAVLLFQERTRQAAVDIDLLESIEGESERVLLLKAELAKQRGQIKTSLELYERLFRRDMKNRDAFIGLVGAYLAGENAPAALDLISRHLDTHHDDRDVLRMAGGALRAMGRSDLAVPVFRRIAIHWPSNLANDELMDAYIGAYVEAAEDARLRGDKRQAELLYDEALEKAPGNPEILRAIAALDAGAGRYGDALERFELALESDPDDTWGVIGKANVLAAQGNHQRALRHLEQAWENTRDVWIGLHYARTLIDLNRLGEADRHLRQVEEYLERQTVARQGALTQANHRGHNLSDRTVISHFVSAWSAVARKEIRVAPAVKMVKLPTLTPEELRLEPVLAAQYHAQGLVLEDVDPTLSVAVVSGDEPGTKAGGHYSVTDEEIDLAALDRLLKELREAPKHETHGGGYPADRPMLSFEGVGTQIETLEDHDAPQVSALAYEVDAFSPFRPTISERRVVHERKKEAQADPQHFAREQRKRLDYLKASRLSVGGGVDARTGSPGTTAMVAAAGELRVDILPVPSFDIYAFVRPEVVSNLIEAQEGVAFGGGTAFQAGSVSVVAQGGSSPVGFLTDPQFVGFAKLGFMAIPHLGLEVELAREGIRDSLLSYAGLTDATTGEVWGRVARTRASGTAYFHMDNRAQLSLGGDYAWYDGIGVEDNLWAQGRLDFRYLTWQEDLRQRVHIGLDSQFFAFSDQLDQFEPGFGGYFSPELFVMARGRIWYEGQLANDKLWLSAHGGIGGQYTVGEDTLYMQPGLRPAVVAGLGLNYRLGPSVALDLSYEFDNAGADYTRNTLWVQLQKRFGIDSQ